MNTINSKFRELDTIKTEFATLKVSLETSRGETVKEFSSMKKQLDKLDEMKKESTEKDRQLNALQREVESLQAAQSEIMKYVSTETINRIKQDIKELKEFKANVEKTLKKSRKSLSDTKKSNN